MEATLCSLPRRCPISVLLKLRNVYHLYASLAVCRSHFFCASWVERCDKTPIHTKDTLRVAPLWSCVMDSQGRAPPRSKQNRLVHGCVHNVGWLIFPSKLAPVVVCSLECDPLIVHILTSSFVTCCGCEMSLPMLFCAVIVEIDFMSSLPCGKKLKFCTLYLRSATVSVTVTYL